LFLLFGCERASTPSATPISPIPVLGVLPTTSDISLELETIGTLRAVATIPIYPEMDGRLQEVLISEGQWVKAGTPLFKIDDQNYTLKMNEAKAQIAIDEAAFAEAERKLARYNRLRDRAIISESEWDRHQTEVLKASNVVKLDQTRLEMIFSDLDRCTITSPMDGRIGKIEAFAGHLVSTKDALTRLLQMDPLLVEFSLTEQEFEKLQGTSHPFTVRPLYNSASAFMGDITFIDNDFDSKTGQIFIRGKIPNSELTLRPGQLVQIKVPFEMKKDALAIPLKAVKHNANGPYVYLLGQDNTAEMRKIAIGEEIGQEVIVLEGINTSDFVITEGHLRLYPGVKVEVK
jgi:multidrug efflux system membrane fusion protein